MVVLGGGAVSYEQGAPVHLNAGGGHWQVKQPEG